MFYSKEKEFSMGIKEFQLVFNLKKVFIICQVRYTQNKVGYIAYRQWSIINLLIWFSYKLRILRRQNTLSLRKLYSTLCIAWFTNIKTNIYYWDGIFFKCFECLRQEILELILTLYCREFNLPSFMNIKKVIRPPRKQLRLKVCQGKEQNKARQWTNDILYYIMYIIV